MVSATSNTSLYDNVASGKLELQRNKQTVQHLFNYRNPIIADTLSRNTKSQETNTMTITTSVSTQNHVGSQVGQDSNKQKMQDHEETCKSEGTQAGGTLQNSHGHMKTMSQGTATRGGDRGDRGGRDYPEDMGHDMHLLSNSRRSKSKSTEDMNVGK